MSELLKVEFHCHSAVSGDSLNWIPDLLAAARRRGIDRLVITDHNAIAGALEAQALDPARVIVGEEIKTEVGELLAAFVREAVPRGLPPYEAIERLRRQGAFISVSHPFDLERSGWPLAELEKITPLVDAIEVFNSRCYQARFNTQAADYAREHNLAGTVGSDAHMPFEVGRSTMHLPAFRDAGELRTAIRGGQAHTRLSPTWVHFFSTYARVYKAIRKEKNRARAN